MCVQGCNAREVLDVWLMKVECHIVAVCLDRRLWLEPFFFPLGGCRVREFFFF